jgi:hypothetical protein
MGKCNVSGFAKEVNFVRRHKQKNPAGIPGSFVLIKKI